MHSAFWHPDSSRHIVRRIIFETDLQLVSPAHFGNGDSDAGTDMPLLVDELDGVSPLIPGTSLCGALRAYLRSVESGHRQAYSTSMAGQDGQISEALFGNDKTRKVKMQSRVIVSDAIGQYVSHEQRHGVKINMRTKTAEESALYSYRLWGTGTIFPIKIQLLILDRDDRDRLVAGLATSLAGLSNGSITLGAKKTRGFGRIAAGEWQMHEYDLAAREGLLEWIASDASPSSAAVTLKDISQLAVAGRKIEDKRREFCVDVTLKMDSALMIRSRQGLRPDDPDVVHIQRPAGNGKGSEPIIPGTSWNGALRAHATRILSLLDADAVMAVECLFGTGTENGVALRLPRKASRISIDESVVQSCRDDLVQNRVAIDPFTGGARDTALFDESPVFSTPDTKTRLRFKIINPQPQDIGLSLLLLKDLWTGELPVGGEASIGRGRFHGVDAMLELKDGKGATHWGIKENSGKLDITGDRDALESYVSSLSSSEGKQ